MTRPIKINPAVASIPYGDRKQIKELTAGRQGLIDLMSGNPYTAMPSFIRDRIKQRTEAGPMRYTSYWGMPELREKLAVKLRSDCGIEADPEEEILITHGVQEALYTLMSTLLLPGDEVLIPSPHYANYLLNTVACRAEPVFVPLREEDGFVPRISDLQRKVNKNTRMLFRNILVYLR